MIDLLA